MRILYFFPHTWLKRHPHRKSQRRPRTLSSEHEGENTHAPPPTQSAPRLTWPPTNARTDCSGCLPEKVPSKPTIDPANGCTTPNCAIGARSLPSVPSSAWRPHTPCTQSVDPKMQTPYLEAPAQEATQPEAASDVAGGELAGAAVQSSPPTQRQMRPLRHQTDPVTTMPAHWCLHCLCHRRELPRPPHLQFALGDPVGTSWDQCPGTEHAAEQTCHGTAHPAKPPTCPLQALPSTA